MGILMGIVMVRWLPALGALTGLSGVLLGAFGAHALADHFAEVPARHDWYQTATLYHLVHAVPILIAGGLAVRGRRAAATAALLFLAGVVLFSGSLYAMALTDQRWLGSVTPFGGFSLILGWLALCIVLWREARRPGSPPPPSPPSVEL